MTLDEVRSAKEAAESNIRRRLIEFQQITGMCPVGLSLASFDATTYQSPRTEYAVGNVTIEMERI